MRKIVGRRFRLIVMLVLAFLLLLALLFYFKLTPLVRELAVTQVENQASDAISDAVNAQIANGEIAYDKIVTLEKNAAGQITALKTNMAQINQLRREIMSLINQRVLDLNVYELGVPVGSVIVPTVFSGLGPKLPVSVASVNNACADFNSSFSEAGINQTLHQIIMRVTMDVTILVAGGTQKASISQDIVVAETVIVGVVPDSFFNVGT